MGRDQWIKLAACRGMPIELFTPSQRVGSPSPAERSKFQFARSICQGCAVAVECLDWAMETRQSELIYGGTLPHTRARLRYNENKRIRKATAE